MMYTLLAKYLLEWKMFRTTVTEENESHVLYPVHFSKQIKYNWVHKSW
jgi:hypothetical protein